MIDFQYISIPLNCTQLLYVGKLEDNEPVKMVNFELVNDEWVKTGFNQTVNIGRNGFALPRKKTEGDLRTPTGLFKVGLAFGYGDFCLTGLDYRKIEENHFWVDDAENENYNQWVDFKPECSAEKMRREDGLYQYGFVIEYNSSPIVAGKGSAIFVHIEKGTGQATHGCLSMPEEALVELLAFLDIKKNPHILMGV